MPQAPLASEVRPPSAGRVPTLTEVVEFAVVPDDLPVLHDAVTSASGPLVLGKAWDAAPAEPVADLPTQPESAQSLQSQVCVPPAAPQPDPQALTDAVLDLLAPRIDDLFEHRLREAMAPALARAAEGLIRDLREDLAVTLQELVAEAVAQALHRQRGE